jgi:hypothetical protein
MYVLEVDCYSTHVYVCIRGRFYSTHVYVCIRGTFYSTHVYVCIRRLAETDDFCFAYIAHV